MRQYVAVILVNSKGLVLAQHRDNKPGIDGPDTWCTVGGSKEETDINLESAAARELLEETGYVIRPTDLRFLCKDIYTKENGAEVERTIFWAVYDERQEIKCFEGQEISFVSPHNFAAMNIYPKHEDFLRLASEEYSANKS